MFKLRKDKMEKIKNVLLQSSNGNRMKSRDKGCKVKKQAIIARYGPFIATQLNSTSSGVELCRYKRSFSHLSVRPSILIVARRARLTGPQNRDQSLWFSSFYFRTL